ncbi:UNVERIFIED_CONTAM: hypothetical protein FKN15_040104 [Acipenser sinensis]
MFPRRKYGVVVVMDEIELVKATKDRDREEIAFDLDLKAVNPWFTLLFQNMDTVRATGEINVPQYQPLSLNRLQYLIDLGRIDPTQPIDLTQLVNGRAVTVQPLKRDYGVQLVVEPLKRDYGVQLVEELTPGWVVNMAEKKILEPTDEKLLSYYRS